VAEQQAANPSPDPEARRYAQEHLRFLQEARPDVLAELRQHGNLDSYLSSVGESASEMSEHLMSQALASKEVQSLPYHQKVRELQSRQREVEELIQHDLICQPAPPGSD
jgi:hypothetical protein